MRFTVILIALVLLPVMVAVHAWDYAEHQEGVLAEQAREILKREGVRGATVDLRFLDLSVTGDAPDTAALERATVALKNLRPTRLMHNNLTILARLSARLQDQTLVVEGWLPPEASAGKVVDLLGSLRPDLKINAAGLSTSPQVRWPEGEKGLPLSADSPMIQAITAGMRATPSLEIKPQGDVLMVAGILPDQGVKDAVVKALQDVAPRLKVDAAGLRVTRYIEAAPFARQEALAAFLRSFYSTPTEGSFTISSNKGPHLKASATPTLESEWLALLRPLSGGLHVEMEVALYPSVYHIPGYQPRTPLPVETLDSLRQSLSDFYILFDASATSLSASARVRLAGLIPTLLAAGPSLKLVVGGHPEPDGQAPAEKRLALARAEQVVSYLIEQGAPGADLQAVAFDPVPAGSAGAPLQHRSVEILIK